MPQKPPTRQKSKQERLAAALRENLKRRKAGARLTPAKPEPENAPVAPDRPNTAQKKD